MNEILMCTPESFLEQIKTQSHGTLLNLKQLLIAKYDEVNATRQAVLSLSEQVKDEDKERFQHTLNNLMVAMQLIEDRVNILITYLEPQK